MAARGRSLLSLYVYQGSHRTGKVMENGVCLEKSWNTKFSIFIMKKSYSSWKNHGISEKVLEINKKSPWILFSTNLYFSIHELSFIWKLKKRRNRQFPLRIPQVIYYTVWYFTGAPGIRKSSALFPSYESVIACLSKREKKTEWVILKDCVD